MTRLRRLAIAFALLTPLAAWAKPCPLKVGMAANGSLYASRGGAWVRQSRRMFAQDIGGGCYPEGGPSPTSSVTIYTVPSLPHGKLVDLLNFIATSGFPKQEVRLMIWKNFPNEPR